MLTSLRMQKSVCKKKLIHLKNSYLFKDVFICLNQLVFEVKFKSYEKIQLKNISFKTELTFFMKIIISPLFDNYPYIGIMQSSIHFRLWYFQVK